MTPEAKAEWKLVPHSYPIADTGDYDGCYEITNGNVSFFTKDDPDDETFKAIVDTLNNSGCKFYPDYSLKNEIDFLKSVLESYRQASQAISDEDKTDKRISDISPRIANHLLLMRDALVASDTSEAYHQLYSIVSPDFDVTDPPLWKRIEEIRDRLVNS